MKFKKGDLVTHCFDPSRIPSSMRGIVVEVADESSLHRARRRWSGEDNEPLYRVLWVTHHQPAWHYEEDLCSVG